MNNNKKLQFENSTEELNEDSSLSLLRAKYANLVAYNSNIMEEHKKLIVQDNKTTSEYNELILSESNLKQQILLLELEVKTLSSENKNLLSQNKDLLNKNKELSLKINNIISNVKLKLIEQTKDNEDNKVSKLLNKNKELSQKNINVKTDNISLLNKNVVLKEKRDLYKEKYELLNDDINMKKKDEEEDRDSEFILCDQSRARLFNTNRYNEYKINDLKSTIEFYKERCLDLNNKNKRRKLKK